MSTAEDFDVGFGYGGIFDPYYTPTKAQSSDPSKWIGPYHRGDDRFTPVGTTVIINGTQIGLTGATGDVSGPHLHIGKEIGTQLVDPKDQGFHLAAPATVMAIGKDAKEGIYVHVTDGNGVKWLYMHLSRVDVKVSQVLGKELTVNEENAAKIVQRSFFYITGVDPTTAEEKEWTAKVLQDPNIIDELEDFLNDSPKGQQFQFKARHYDEDIKAAQGDAIKLEHGKKYLAP